MDNQTSECAQAETGLDEYTEKTLARLERQFRRDGEQVDAILKAVEARLQGMQCPLEVWQFDGLCPEATVDGQPEGYLLGWRFDENGVGRLYARYVQFEQDRFGEFQRITEEKFCVPVLEASARVRRIAHDFMDGFLERLEAEATVCAVAPLEETPE
jgi:hypothetical protein